MPRFVPSDNDVRTARMILASCRLPTELVLAILEYARYWSEVTHENINHRELLDEHFSIRNSRSLLYLWANLPEKDPGYEDENPKIKEIEFAIVSHDQGWTTENTRGTYRTSSWFEVSIFRESNASDRTFFDIHREEWANLEDVQQYCMRHSKWRMVPRSSSEMDANRLHCSEMIHVGPKYVDIEGNPIKEGYLSWYLQGNLVAKGTSVFEGEMVKRYHVVWGSSSNPRVEGNEGAGKGEGFIDSLQKGDIIAVWARAKRRGWENHVYGIRMTLRYTI